MMSIGLAVVVLGAAIVGVSLAGAVRVLRGGGGWRAVASGMVSVVVGAVVGVGTMVLGMGIARS